MSAFEKCQCCSILEVKVDNIENDMVEFKHDVRNHLKEIREESKQDRRFFVEAIDQLKTNSIKLSTLMEKITEQVEKQDNKMVKQDETIHEISKDVVYLRQSMDANQTQEEDSDKIWYREIIMQGAKVFMYILLLVLGVALGLNASDIAGFLGK